MQRLHASYLEARDAEDYNQSDALRSQLLDCGAVDGQWHPVYESPNARALRLAKRYLFREAP